MEIVEIVEIAEIAETNTAFPLAPRDAKASVTQALAFLSYRLLNPPPASPD